MEQNHTNNQNQTEEVDLGKLIQLIGRGFQKVFEGILRIFIYLKRRAIILLGLILIGVAIGYTLKQFVSQKYKIEVLVEPNLESKNYLYDVVSEIQSNLDAQNLAFFKEMGIDTDLSSLMITIERIGKEEPTTEQEIEYLEMLLGFENSAIISDVVRAEILNKTSFSHKITFYFKNPETGNDFAKKVMDYINSNPYYEEMLVINKENAVERIKEDKALIGQIDEIINNYASKMTESQNTAAQGQITLDNEKPLDVPGLFDLKNSLIRDIESKKLELLEKKQAIRVINFGKPQIVQKTFFGKKIVLLPVILIGLFFLWDFIRYLDKRSRQLLDK